MRTVKISGVSQGEPHTVRIGRRLGGASEAQDLSEMLVRTPPPPKSIDI
jgi:hypothetical protein